MFANKSKNSGVSNEYFEGEDFGNVYEGKDLNIEKNRYDIDIKLGGVGDPYAWEKVFKPYIGGFSWFYNPRYTADLQIYEIPAELRVNLESYRKVVDPNPDNWVQRYNGQWKYYPEGNPSMQVKRVREKLLKKQKERKAEKSRIDEGIEEIRSAESYHSEESQPSNIPGMLTPKMPNLENLPDNEYNRDLIKRIRRSYKKLKREYPTRPMGDRVIGLYWSELENFKDLVFELNYQRQAIINDQVGRNDFIYPRGRGWGPLTSLTPFSIQELGFGSAPRTRIKIQDEPWYRERKRNEDPWNGWITRDHASQLNSINSAYGLNRIPATIKYWILHSKITWRLYTEDYSLTQRFIDTIDRIVRDAVRGGRDFRQEVRTYLRQQGMVGQEIENLLQDLSGVLLELMNIPGNILKIPGKAYNYLKDLFTSYFNSEPEPEPEAERPIVSQFVPYRRRRSGRKTRKKPGKSPKKKSKNKKRYKKKSKRR